MSSYNQINDVLRSRFGVEINFSCNLDDLCDLMEHYVDRRELIVNSMGNDAAIRNADYAKSHLISEAVRMYLREIAPKRLNKTKRKK